MPFQIKALPKPLFSNLFSMSPEELAAINALRVVADQKPGFPCRVSLQDADVGEELILAHYEHQPANTPFKASHGIYIRSKADQAELLPGEVPQMLRSRILSLRAFDAAGMLLAADLAEGTALEQSLEEMFKDEQTAYIHIHFARPGCYAARADRLTVKTQTR